jgi:signal transduction histidine kinase
MAAFALLTLSALLDWPSGDAVGSIRLLAQFVIAVFVLALLASAAREQVSRREEDAALAVAEERRRLARELHDGVAQDLAFIVSQSLRMTRSFPDEPALERIAAAAERALADSRATITGLAAPRSATLGAAVCDQAYELAERAGLLLELEVADDIDTTAEVEHAVLRIIREAISNASRHANATTVAISVSSTADGLRVRVADDGRGFDPARIATSGSGGFGLASMDERARALGGEMRLESQPGVGTVVELALP